MLYNSTRNKKLSVSSAQAIFQGLSDEGGLFVPSKIPTMDKETLDSFTEMSYCEIAKKILSPFLSDFSSDEISDCVKRAYGNQFDTQKIAPVAFVEEGVSYLELWHGPTCAFKDMALQLLPHLLVSSKEKCKSDDTVVILVATSGDTGKAALEGFRDTDGTKIMVFYPQDGVSNIQKRQMQTQEGHNVNVCAVKGNFDDAQSGVKQIFSDKLFAEEIKNTNHIFSSANSINWGRLVPQIIYYFSAYAQMVKENKISLGEEINVCVPTGNFGNILAAYYAKRMGLPIHKLICASNKNNVLTHFIENGVYDRNRTFYTTSSPSMDILISSNLERLLYHMSGEDDGYVLECQEKLKNTGAYSVSKEILEKIQNDFSAGWCSEMQTKNTIQSLFERTGYLIDTHTAVAAFVAEEYRKSSGDERETLVVSTASPYKFANAVLDSLGSENCGYDDFQLLQRLEHISGLPIPKNLSTLQDKKIRFEKITDVGDMRESVRAFVNK